MTHIDSLVAREWTDPKTTKPHILPIYATSSYSHEDLEQSIRLFTKEEQGHVYSRYGNPTVEATASKIAALESAGSTAQATAVLTNSGMSAIHVLVSSLLKPGDKILTQPNLYGGTTELLQKIFGAQGIDLVLTDFKDADQTESILQADPRIRLIYFETPTNPTLSCVDIELIANVGKQYNRWTAMDNTFATPCLQRPLALGVDFVIHSTTKYLNGHGNGIAGVVVGRDPELIREKIWETLKLTGANCSPFEAWLTYQGMKTLALRMQRHCDNAFYIAEALQKHPNISQVNYPGLSGHPAHSIAKKQMTRYGGMLSFEVRGGLEKAKQVINRMTFCTLAPTLGDVDTLVLHPASSSHLKIDPEIRREAGIGDGLIRLSVGIEYAQDILDDILQALD